MESLHEIFFKKDRIHSFDVHQFLSRSDWTLFLAGGGPEQKTVRLRFPKAITAMMPDSDGLHGLSRRYPEQTDYQHGILDAVHLKLGVYLRGSGFPAAIKR